MDYEIRVSDDGTYVILKIIGPTGRHRFAQVVEAHVLGASLGLRRYLVDLTEATNTESPLESYDLAYHDFPEDDRIDRFARVAALVSPGDHSHDFLVTVFRNAGSIIETFEDLESARRYLLP